MVVWLGWALLVLIAAYLLGSIPTGYLAGRILKGIDIREHGSGSTGATNVLRTLGKWPALGVLAMDVLKGALAIAMVQIVYALPAMTALAPATVNLNLWIPWTVTLVGLAALLGHSKSVWIGFTGGKSVAAGLGVFLAMSWAVGLCTLGVFAAVLALSRIVSLGSMAAAVAGIIFMVTLGQPLPYQLLALIGGAYIVVRHRANIERLLAGTEPRIGQKPQPESGQSIATSEE